jgi:hypothetical protein
VESGRSALVAAWSGVAEVDGDTGVASEPGVPGHFDALVPGDVAPRVLDAVFPLGEVIPMFLWTLQS